MLIFEKVEINGFSDEDELDDYRYNTTIDSIIVDNNYFYTYQRDDWEW